MRFLIVFGLLLYCAPLIGESFTAGLTVDFPVEEFEDPAHVWLPTNYDPESKWPVMFYYHGTSGKPTIEFPRLISDSKNWVLVGMGYKQKGTFEYTEENLKAEIDIFQEMLAEVKKRVSVNESKIYVSGVSKGGWMTGLFLQKIPGLAGGMIMAGGFMEAKPGQIDTDDHVYIGVGEADGNIAMSYGARERFKKGGAKVTLDSWAGLGHQLPNAYDVQRCIKIRQWMKVQSGFAGQGEAIEWCDKRMREIRTLAKSDKVTAFHQLITLSDKPFLALVDKEANSSVKELQDSFRNDPELKNEMVAWVEFQKAITFEGKDRYLSTLAEALSKYQKIIELHPDTVFGKKAAASRDRVKMIVGIE